MEKNPTQTQTPTAESLTVATIGWVRSAEGNWVRAEDSASEAAQNREEEIDQNSINRDVLAGSEAGVLLVEAYDAAIALDPRLSELQIVPIAADDNPNKFAFARHKNSERNTSGKYEIHVRLSDLDEALGRVQTMLDTVPGLREMMAEQMYIDNPAELTPMQLHTFVILHEMGHISEYMDFEEGGRAQELAERQKREKEALPLGSISTGSLLNPESRQRAQVEASWDEVCADYGVSSMDELIAMKNRAHRNMTSERYADSFASDVLASQPFLMDQMAQSNLERYRKHPYAERAMLAA